MRKIKFRGKIVGAYIGDDQQKNWFYGSLVNELSTGKTYILDVTHTDKGEARFNNLGLEVNPNTVGQFTGLYDKNGVEIYEEDVVKIVNNYSEATKKTHNNVVVKFKNGSFIVTWDVDGDEHYNHFTSYNTPVVTFEVIGNIHEEITNETNQPI